MIENSNKFLCVRVYSYVLLAIFLTSLFTNSSWSSEDRIDRAYSYYMTGNMDKAVEELKQAITENPQDPIAHFILAMCYVRQGNEKEARTKFDEAFTVGKKDPRFLRFVAEYFEAAGKYDEAIDSYFMVIYLSPDDPEPYLELAKIYALRKGEFDNARKVLDKCLELNPSKETLITSYLLLANISNTVDGQKKYYKKVLEIDPDNPLAKTMLKFIKMGGEYGRNVALSPEAEEHYAKAEKYFRERNFEAAIEQYEKVITLEPRFAKAHLYLGDCYFVMDRYDEAFPHFKRATEVDPKNPQAWAFLADTYNKLGDYESAYQYYKIAVDLDPGYYNAVAKLKQIGKLLETKKDRVGGR